MAININHDIDAGTRKFIFPLDWLLRPERRVWGT